MNSNRPPEEPFQHIDAFDSAFDNNLNALRNLTIKVPIYTSQGELRETHEYQLNANKKLGRSATSRVYAATRVLGADDDRKLTPQYYAIKIMRHPATDPESTAEAIQQRLTHIQKEVGYLRWRCPTEQPLFIQEKATFIISESFPGQELCSDMGKIHPDLIQLDFTQRTKVAAQLVSKVNELHHTKPTTGPALIHGDLKGSNIKLYVNPLSLDTEVYVLDYGISLEAPETEEALAPHPQKVKGSFVYFPLETAASQFGIKTDTYMLVALLTVIFGESSPYRIKTKDCKPTVPLKKEEEARRFQTPYPVDKVMSFPSLYHDINIHDLTINMLNRMQSNTYQNRPDSDEVMLFFVLLNKLACVHKQTPHDAQTKAAIIARMWMLTTTEWYGPISTASLPSGRTFNEFDCGKDSLATLTIVTLCNRDLKRHLPHQPPTPDRAVLTARARAIALLSDKRLLNDDLAITICSDTPLSDVVVATVFGDTPALTLANRALFAGKKSAASAYGLIGLAAHHGHWDTVARLLLMTPIASLDKTLIHLLDQNSENLILSANRIFKNMHAADQLDFVKHTVQKQNALGAILNAPRSSIRFLFTSKKFANTAITARMERLIGDLACYRGSEVVAKTHDECKLSLHTTRNPMNPS